MALRSPHFTRKDFVMYMLDCRKKQKALYNEAMEKINQAMIATAQAAEEVFTVHLPGVGPVVFKQLVAALQEAEWYVRADLSCTVPGDAVITLSCLDFKRLDAEANLSPTPHD